MMQEKNFGALSIRKWYRFEEDVLACESGLAASAGGVKRVAIGALIHNPAAGGFAQDLSSIVAESVALGHEFGRRMTDAFGGTEIQSYGKACIVGTAGEYENGNAFLTTEFANPIRAAIGGALAWIPSTGKLGGPGTSIDIPMAHKDALYVRSHYDTMTVSMADGPLPSELVVLFACASQGRIGARLGGLKPSEIKARDGLR